MNDDLQSLGTLEGRPGAFDYVFNYDEREGTSLSWTTARQEKHEGPVEASLEISCKDVICMINKSDADKDGVPSYEILMVEHVLQAVPPSSDNDKNVEKGEEEVEEGGKDKRQQASSLRLRVFKASNLPRRFVQDFGLEDLPTYLSMSPSSSSTTDSSSVETRATDAGPIKIPNIFIIISMGSGTGTGQSLAFFNHVLQPTLSILGISPNAYTVVKTTSAQTIKDFGMITLRSRACQGRVQTVILLSGDGGIHDLVNGLLLTIPSRSKTMMDSDSYMSMPAVTPLPEGYVPPTIGLLALGTANALAYSSGLLKGSSGTLGLRCLLNGMSSPRPLPLFHVIFSPGAKMVVDQGRARLAPPTLAKPWPSSSLNGAQDERGLIHGAIVFSYGLHASLVANSDSVEYRRQGPSRFQSAATDLLFPRDGSKPHIYRASIFYQRSTTRTQDGVENGNEFEKKDGEWRREKMAKGEAGAGKAGEGEGDREARKGWEEIPRKEHGYVLVSMVSNLEEKFVISPLSSSSSTNTQTHPLPDDQGRDQVDGKQQQQKEKRRFEKEEKMYLIHFGPLSGPEVGRIMALAYQEGQHVSVPEVGYEAITGLHLQMIDHPDRNGNGKNDDDNEDDGKWRRVCLDGTIIELETGGWAELRKGPCFSFIPSSSSSSTSYPATAADDADDDAGKRRSGRKVGDDVRDFLEVGVLETHTDTVVVNLIRPI